MNYKPGEKKIRGPRLLFPSMSGAVMGKVHTEDRTRTVCRHFREREISAQRKTFQMTGIVTPEQAALRRRAEHVL